MARKRKKIVQKICKNCKLFDPNTSTCAVVVLHEGERLHLPVGERDACFFEGEFFSEKTKTIEKFTEDIQEVKFWVEDKDGKKTDKDGTVKIEYPTHGFFGDMDLSDYVGL